MQSIRAIIIGDLTYRKCRSLYLMCPLKRNNLSLVSKCMQIISNGLQFRHVLSSAGERLVSYYRFDGDRGLIDVIVNRLQFLANKGLKQVYSRVCILFHNQHPNCMKNSQHHCQQYNDHARNYPQSNQHRILWPIHPVALLSASRRSASLLHHSTFEYLLSP